MANPPGEGGGRRGCSIRVSGLRVSYGSVKAVDGVSFTADEGDVTCLVGPNGAGKSTVLKVLVGIVKPDDGAVDVCGLSVNGAKRIIGYVPEQPTLFDSLTPREVIQLAKLIYNANDDEWISELLKMFNLGQFLDVPIGRLSMGVKQRVHIVLALLHKPRILVMDEPFNWLDIASSVVLEDLLARFKDGRIIIMSSHIVDLLMRLCDKMIFMKGGRIVNIRYRGDFPSIDTLKDFVVKIS